MSSASAFINHIDRPASEDGTSLVLLHGSGGDETTMLEFGRQIAPNAVLVGVRGRSLDEGFPRWFRRLSMSVFDQQQIREEAKAFAEFLPQLFDRLGLKLQQSVFVGYSNGANFISALMLLHPELLGRAILMRAMPALEHSPAADLSHHDVLMITGRTDPYGTFAPELERLLRERGTRLTAHLIGAGHELRNTDVELSKSWLADQVQDLRKQTT